MKLLEFQSAQDPMLAMLEWMAERLMELEIKQKCNAPKGVHEEARTAYRSGYRTVPAGSIRGWDYCTYRSPS
jgi:hypothetical protein